MTRPDRLPDLPGRLSAWLAEGAQGTMDWMAERADQRASPIALWPGVRSILVLAMSYRPEHDPLDLVGRRDRGAVAAYAQRRDYHEVLKGRLKELGGYLSAKGDVRVKVFCDTAPVMEKTLAEAAGLGWQGKHTVLISRGHGNWLLLGAIYTSAEFEPDAPERDHCGSCRACLDVCPTDAFPAPYRLDARRCISYLTIEHARADPGGVPGGDRQPGLRLRRLPGRLPLEQVRPHRGGEPARRARGAGVPGARGSRGTRRRGVPRLLRRHAGEAYGARPLPAQRHDRDRQFG
ncbi:epoxyqueuosine reductase [Methylobacterium radiotolerans]